MLTAIPSVPYLETLLLLRGAEQSNWTPSEVARRIYVGEAQALDLLEALRMAGVVSMAADGSKQFRYAPRSVDLADLLNEVAQSYATNLFDVTALIHSRVDRRAQQFSDAFRWKKTEEN